MGGEKDVGERQKRDKKRARREWSRKGGFLQTLKQLSSRGEVMQGHGGITVLANRRELYSHTHTQQQNARHQLPDDSNLAVIKPRPAWTYKQKKPTAYRLASADSLAPVSGGCRSVQTHSCLRLCREKTGCLTSKTHTSPLWPVQFLTH